MYKNSCTLFAFLFATAYAVAQTGSKPIELKDIFYSRNFSFASAGSFAMMNDGENYTTLNSSGTNWSIEKQNIKDKSASSLLQSSQLIGSYIPKSPQNYEFSANEEWVLIFENTESIYRNSSQSLVSLINLNTKNCIKISESKIMYPTLSPDNGKLAYVLDNNIYLLSITDNKTIAITTDGKKNEIINGAVDWVYEEEFAMSQGLFWNNTGTHLAYYKFNESNVKEFSMDIFKDLYPNQERWKYPKAGEDNSRVDVAIWDAQTKTSSILPLNSENDQYIPRIQWTNDANTLSVQRLNRLQNHWELLFCKTDASSPQLILEEKNNTYVEITDNLRFIGNSQLLYTSEKSGFNHIYCFDFEKKKEKAITNGNWEVLSICGTDDKSKTIYYTSTENSILEDHLYAVSYTGNNKKQLRSEPGNHSITMQKGNKYYIDAHSTFNQVPNYTLYSVDGSFSIPLADNNKVRSKMSEYAFGKHEFKTINTSNTSLQSWIIYPPNFDASKKYPVLMHCYGGPGRNTVSNSYGYSNYLWHSYLAQQGYIVVSVDNRGTLKQGADFKKSTYKQLGKLEQIDQTDAAKYFANLPYVDSSRIGIWGWSFGGYLTSLCLTKAPQTFKLGIAVAPVTNWRYYDNIYTERFLQRPQDNASGYDDNSPINFVKNLKGKYLIIHGTADDNVHYQNSVEMIEAMIQANVDFDSEIYPNKNHSIYGGNTRYHLYKRMTNYILQNL